MDFDLTLNDEQKQELIEEAKERLWCNKVSKQQFSEVMSELIDEVPGCDLWNSDEVFALIDELFVMYTKSI